MHLTLWLEGASPSIRVPVSNLHLFQSLIYRILPEKLASFLHNEGYGVDGKRLKLFAMSWPIAPSPPIFANKTIIFPLPLKLVISTPVTNTLDGIAKGMLTAEQLRVGNNLLYCHRMEIAIHKIKGESMEIKTLSPITCYEQIRRNNKPYTVYFEPHQPEFVTSLHNNLVRKYKALYPGRVVPEGRVTLSYFQTPKERIARYSPETPFPIKGWTGRFKLAGPPELLQIGLDSGLGSKNSSGWGCVMLV